MMKKTTNSRSPTPYNPPRSNPSVSSSKNQSPGRRRVSRYATRQQGARFVETLKVLAVQGKYQTTGEKPIVNNYEMAVHEMAKQDPDFDKYLKAPGGPWKTRKYDALY